MVEVLPYAAYLNDNSLFPSDFFIQNIVHDIPNERFLIALLLAMSGSQVALWSGILHFLCTFFLLWAFFRIGKRYIQSDELVWLSILLCFVPFYGINLGGNEAYINMFTSSTLAKALGAWTLVFFLDHKYWLSFSLISLATFAQPLVGVQLFLLLSGVLVIGRCLGHARMAWSSLVWLCLGFVLTGGLWIIFLKMNFDQGAIDAGLFFEIMEFRTPHHFFPNYYPLKSYAVLIPLFIIAALFYRTHSWKISLFFALAVLGLFVFTLGVLSLKWPIVLTTQWFKTTVWLKVFAFFSVLHYVEHQFSERWSRWWDKIAPVGLVLTALVCIGMMMHPVSFFKNKNYDFCFVSPSATEIDIAKQARAKTPRTALFLYPADNTSFKCYSERSAYVDYKSLLHRGNVMPIWYERIQKIYQINLATRRSGEDLMALANAHFYQLDEATLRSFGKGKITHLLTRKMHQLDFPVVAENKDFIIYKIR